MSTFQMTSHGDLLSSLQKSFAVIQQLESQLEAQERAKSEPIAIIGMGCRFPSANNPTAFWQLLQEGRDAVAEIPPERFPLDTYFANVLPEDKAVLIKQWQAEGKYVCYIGDGINDSIALKQAHLSISLRGASTIATDTAAIILMDGGLSQLGQLFDIAEQFENNLRRTLMITVLPGFVSMSGVLFLHFGIITTILLNQVGLAVGQHDVTRNAACHKERDRFGIHKLRCRTARTGSERVADTIKYSYRGKYEKYISLLGSGTGTVERGYRACGALSELAGRGAG